MVDEMIRDQKKYMDMDVSAETMKAIGFKQEDIDQARKPEGFVHGGTRYLVRDLVSGKAGTVG